MKNQPCYDKEGNFLGWFSRSVAVVNIVFAYGNDNELYVLASQRGTGTPDPEYVGKWNAICGYLDFDEDAEEAAKRETFEETGVRCYNTRFWTMMSDPKKDKRQNISIRFITKASFLENTSMNYCEYNEVADVKWINVRKLGDYEWAFNHDDIIREAVIYFNVNMR